MTGVGEFYRKDIDGLRAIAILTVVAHHVRIPGFTGGFVGVDVFFVISGFLITSILAAEIRKTGSLSLPAFYARRIRRLFPALVVMVLTTCLLGAVVLLPIFGQQQELGRSAIATALYFSNIYFWLSAPGYFDPSSDLMPLLHTWSLAVEEQFYLVWPPLILALIAAARCARVDFARALVGLIVASLVVSLAWCIWKTHAEPTAAFYLLPARAWELATGAALALWLPALTSRRPVVGALCSWVGLAAVIAAAVVLHKEMAFPGHLAVAPVFGTALIILGGHLAPQNPAQRFLSTRPMVLVGLLSYSWYLWHWPLLSLTRAYELEAHDPVRDVGVALVSLLVAYGSYRFVENPIRYGRPGPFRRNGPTLAAGAVASLAICLPAGALMLRSGADTGRLSLAALSMAKADRPALRTTCHQDVPFEGLTDPAGCTTGLRDRAPSLMLWGDSHADHLSPLMQAFGEFHPATPTLARSFSRCPPIKDYQLRDARAEADCHAFNAAVLDEVRALRQGGLEGVVLAGRWLRVFGAPELHEMQDMKSGVPAAPLQMPELAENLSQTVAELTRMGLQVLIVAPIPEMPSDIPVCLARESLEHCSVPRAVIDAQRSEVMQLLESIRDRHPGIQIVDFIDQLCDATTCFAERDGAIYYRDEHHLTASASRGLLPAARAPLLDVASPH
jgi:peptidoglycan/LPS O-acetylase OafA/YrhL